MKGLEAARIGTCQGLCGAIVLLPGQMEAAKALLSYLYWGVYHTSLYCPACLNKAKHAKTKRTRAHKTHAYAELDMEEMIAV